MKTTWDEAKRKSNIEKHGVDFAELAPAFDGFMLTELDTRSNYGEDRIISLCAVRLKIFVMVFVETEDGTIRIISARRATANEKSRYLKEARSMG